MPDKKISELTAHTAPLPADLLAIVNGGVTKKIALANLWAALFAPEGTVINGKIVPSVATNNLTVALKTLAGTDPSASDPVYVRIGGIIRVITYAVSVTYNAGFSYANAGSAELATKEIDWGTYLSWNTNKSGGAGVDIAFSRIFHGNLYSDFSSTDTNERAYLANSPRPAAGDQVVNIGRFAATLSAGAGYTWSVPTFTASNLIQRPIYETRWLTAVSTLAGFSSVLLNTLLYKISGEMMFIKGTTLQGTSNATTFTFTLPMANSKDYYLTTYVQDNGSDLDGGQLTINSTATINVYKSWLNVAFTNSGAKAVYLPNLTLYIN